MWYDRAICPCCRGKGWTRSGFALFPVFGWMATMMDIGDDPRHEVCFTKDICRRCHGVGYVAVPLRRAHRVTQEG